jgi:3-phenylpropionate/trans-cinnamate dioxygenase ferredoxin reductase component
VRGESRREEAFVHPPEWYEQNGVELLSGTNVLSLDPGERVARLQTGDEISFDRALLATGAMVNILRVDGCQAQGIHYLRAFGNSDSIREDAKRAEHVVLIGGSYIGTEVAASLTATGTKCTIVCLEETVLSNTFGEEVARYFHEVLTSHGVEVLGGEELDGFEGDERVGAVRTKSGKRIGCEAVVVGVGVRPDAMLAQRAGLEVGDGILCDRTLQTSAEGIYAAGDCCSYDSILHGRRLRIEHWDVAMQQGRAAGGNLLGDGKDYDVVPYFFSDLADWASLEYVGPAYEWDEIVFRGERDSGEFLAWYLKDGKVAAALSVERSEDLAEARRLLESGAEVSGSLEALADPGSELSALG